MSGNRSGALPDRRARPDKRHAPFRSRYYCATHGHWWVRQPFFGLYDWVCTTCGAVKGNRARGSHD